MVPEVVSTKCMSMRTASGRYFCGAIFLDLSWRITWWTTYHGGQKKELPVLNQQVRCYFSACNKIMCLVKFTNVLRISVSRFCQSVINTEVVNTTCFCF